MHIRSIKDFSPYLVHRINKVDGSGKESRRIGYHYFLFVFLCPLFIITFFAYGERIIAVDFVYFFLWGFFLYTNLH
jgi:hypothetical protein